MCLNSAMRQRHTTVRFFGESPRKGEEARESKADRSGGCKRRTRLRRGAFHRDDKFWNLQAWDTDARRCEPRESFRAKYFSSTTGGATRRSLSSRIGYWTNSVIPADLYACDSAFGNNENCNMYDAHKYEFAILCKTRQDFVSFVQW